MITLTAEQAQQIERALRDAPMNVSPNEEQGKALVAAYGVIRAALQSAPQAEQERICDLSPDDAEFGMSEHCRPASENEAAVALRLSAMFVFDENSNRRDDIRDEAVAILGRLGPQADGWQRGAEAMRDVAQERRRQVDKEGWTPEHDDEHDSGEMADAAACYAITAALPDEDLKSDLWRHEFMNRWPWSREWWKPKDRRANLVRAGALILAEIERLDRARPIPKDPKS